MWQNFSFSAVFFIMPHNLTTQCTIVVFMCAQKDEWPEVYTSEMFVLAPSYGLNVYLATKSRPKSPKMPPTPAHQSESSGPRGQCRLRVFVDVCRH